MRFIVWTFTMTGDSWNENRHLNSARSADGVQCSVLGPLVTECMQMLHDPLSTRRSGNDASGLLPKLCGSKHTHIHTRNALHQFRRFWASVFFKYFPFCLASTFMYKSKWRGEEKLSSLPLLKFVFSLRIGSLCSLQMKPIRSRNRPKLAWLSLN